MNPVSVNKIKCKMRKLLGWDKNNDFFELCIDRNIYYLWTVTAKSYFMEIVETCLSI